MDLQVDSSYKIVIEINNSILTYQCRIISQDESFLTFIDNRGKEYTYAKKLILSFTLLDYEISKEVKDGN